MIKIWRLGENSAPVPGPGVALMDKARRLSQWRPMEHFRLDHLNNAPDRIRTPPPFSAGENFKYWSSSGGSSEPNRFQSSLTILFMFFFFKILPRLHVTKIKCSKMINWFFCSFMSCFCQWRHIASVLCCKLSTREVAILKYFQWVGHNKIAKMWDLQWPFHLPLRNSLKWSTNQIAETCCIIQCDCFHQV